MQSHEDVITKANRLLTGLRTSPAAILGQHSRSMKKVNQIHYDYYKLYEGSLSFTMSNTEAEIRKEIASLIREINVFFNDYAIDFAFVCCINWRIRLPDGEMTFDANGKWDP